MSPSRLLAALVLTLAAVLPAAAASSAPPGVVQGAASPGRGLWVWQPVPASVVVPFAHEHGVDRLWLATSSDIGARERRRLLATVRAARQHDIEVAALGGAPGWALRPGDAMNWARRSADVVGALHVDVEPYALPAWDTDRPRVVRGYLDLLDRLHRLPGPLEVDVPFWYGHIRAPGGTLADAVLARVDAVTVMSYRDVALGTNGILDVSRDWLRRGARTGTPITLGAETRPLSGCEHCTFAEEGAPALDREQEVVTRRLQDSPAFAGVAVHDFDGWRALKADGPG